MNKRIKQVLFLMVAIPMIFTISAQVLNKAMAFEAAEGPAGSIGGPPQSGMPEGTRGAPGAPQGGGMPSGTGGPEGMPPQGGMPGGTGGPPGGPGGMGGDMDFD